MKTTTTQEQAKQQIDQRIATAEKELAYWKDVKKHIHGDAFLKRYIDEKYILPLKIKLRVQTKLSSSLRRSILTKNK